MLEIAISDAAKVRNCGWAGSVSRLCTGIKHKRKFSVVHSSVKLRSRVKM